MPSSSSPHWPWVRCFSFLLSEAVFDCYLKPGPMERVCFHVWIDAKVEVKEQPYEVELRIRIHWRKILEPEVSENSYTPWEGIGHFAGQGTRI